MDDGTFLTFVADRLEDLPGVEGIALGGSRAQGTSRPDSDWDLAIYYREGFSPDSAREIGWPGDLSEIGGWGAVFNGGGAVDVDGRTIDIHYRDLGVIDGIHNDALHGEFFIDPLLFHQAGLPSYILLAELGMNRTLRGDLPRWEYPAALRARASGRWWDQAEMTLHYALEGHARRGRVAQCAGLVCEAACRAAHAILAHRGEWITNEKQLLQKAGLAAIDDVIAGAGSDAEALVDSVDRARAYVTAAVRREGIVSD